MKRLLESAVLLLICLLVIIFSNDILKIGYPEKYEAIVSADSEKYGMDDLLIYAVMRAESRYDVSAVSYAGAKGLMQITDDTFEMIRNNVDIPDDIFDPAVNIKAGVWLLSDLYRQLGDITLTVKAYNCGINNLGIKILQTEIFEKRVFEFYDIYVNLYRD
jgi:soluble lytic murein transglycosylase